MLRLNLPADTGKRFGGLHLTTQARCSVLLSKMLAYYLADEFGDSVSLLLCHLAQGLVLFPLQQNLWTVERSYFTSALTIHLGASMCQ